MIVPILLLARLLAAPAPPALDSSAHPWKEVEGPASDKDVKALGFDADVVALLDGKTGRKADVLYGPRGSKWPGVGLVWGAEAKAADAIVHQSREALAAKGYVVFVAERNYGTELDQVGVVKSADRFAPILALGTAGPSFEVSTPDVIAKLQQWDRRAPLDLLGAGPDWLEIEFRQVPADATEIAREARDLAPDSLGRDADSLTRLVDQLQRTRRLMLWWE